MKRIAISLALVLSLFSCSFVSNAETAHLNTIAAIHTVRARITYYCPGQDHWGSRVAMPDVKAARQGTTVAAHPDFKFGTRVYIPALKNVIDDGKFIVQDRGSAVTSKKAARGKAYVFDVFVASNRAISHMSKTTPAWTDVYILN
jgi:3D (Asp-Asp-Asp) domain-containing protein